MFLGDHGDNGVYEQGLKVLSLVPIEFNETLRTEGRISGNGDIFLFSETEEVRLDEVRVVFDLEDGDRDFGEAEGVHEEGTLEVGDTDGASEALFDEALHGLPCFLDGDVNGFDALIDAVFAFVGPGCGVVLVVVDVLVGDGEVNQEEIEIAKKKVGEVCALVLSAFREGMWWERTRDPTT